MQFEISALSHGRRIKVKIDAPHIQAATQQARASGLTVLSAKHNQNNAFKASSLLRSKERFPLTLFSRELLALLSSGLSLVEAIQTLEEKEARPLVRQVLQSLLRQLYEGESLSAAISHQPQHFPALYAATIRASERTGDLPEALERYISYQEKIETVKRKVISASLYPMLLIMVGGLVALFLLGYVTPRFSSLYSDTANLPAGSRLLMQWGSLISEHAVEMLLGFTAVVGGLIYAVSRPQGRAWLVNLAWRTPRLGERLRVFQLTRFYRTTGMLLDGGIPAVNALDMSAGLLPFQLRTKLHAAIQDIKEGKSISQSLQRADLTTPVAMRLLRVGEKSGRMGEMMEASAKFHDDETTRFLEWFTRLFEPVLMLLIGLMIGVIVILLYMPIFELAGSLQ